MGWILKSYEELTKDELYALLHLRAVIFIVEQNSPYIDPDNKDQLSHHLFYQENDGSISACCRLLPPGVLFRESAIGRVVVRADRRGQGLARDMMLQAAEWLEQRWPAAGIKLSGQLYLEDFYKSCGFRTVSDVYLEDGIRHVSMIRYRYCGVKYLGHSCFAVETPKRVLLFDYGSIPDRSTWEVAAASLPDLCNRPLYIFSSHQHADHYTGDTLQLFPQAAFFLHGHDGEPNNRLEKKIVTGESTDKSSAVYPRQTLMLDDMLICCSGSSDQGVAYLIAAPEITVMHGGDLARWDDLPQYSDVQQAETTWLAECIQRTGKPDLALLAASTSDGWQETPLLDGLEDLLQKLQPEFVIPMHAYGYEHLYDSFKIWLENSSELNKKTDSAVLKKPGQYIAVPLKSVTC
ncbi:MAG: ElaA protein [Clostridiales bacterium]|nr:ElaA protein [Clostridiales bacterium]